MSRYLEPKEKEAAMTEWAALVHRGRFTQPGEGGWVCPDEEMVPMVSAFNAIGGVCVIQSCAGHQHPDTDYFYDGQVWLRLSREMSALFDRSVEILVGSLQVKKVDKLYRNFDGFQEIINVQFAGGPEAADACKTVVEFFEVLSRG